MAKTPKAAQTAPTDAQPVPPAAASASPGLAPTFPMPLSSLVKDMDRSFWNGQGTLSVAVEQVVAALESDPTLTVAALRDRLRRQGRAPVIKIGIDFTFATTDPIRIGARHGDPEGLWVGFNINAGIEAWIFLVLAQEGLIELADDHPAELEALLREHTVLTGQEALVVLSCVAQASASFATTVLNKPGLDVGITFSAGGEVRWLWCRPARNDQVLLEAIRGTFSLARLPQTSLDDVRRIGHPILLNSNEILYSAYTGFVTFGGEATLGYEVTGSRDYNLGRLDLATRLVLQARAKVEVDYTLAGAFHVTVLPGTDPGWLRVIVEKDRTSTFDFALGVTVDARLVTTGLPSADEGALALLEAMLGVTTPQVAVHFLTLAQLPIDQLRQKADGFIKAMVESWAGAAFDQLLDDQIRRVLADAGQVIELIDSVDQRLVQVYEKLLDVIDFDAAMAALKGALAQPDPAVQKAALLSWVDQPVRRELIELLVQVPFGQIVVRFEELRSELATRVAEFDRIVSSEARVALGAFIKARVNALGLAPLFASLAEYDTPEKLEAHASEAVKALVERLTGRAFDALMNDRHAREIVAEVNRLARGFAGILAHLNQYVRQALNAKGRIDVSRAYQEVREGEKLVDVQIQVGHQDPVKATAAFDLYTDAVRGRFSRLLRDDHLDILRLSQARFSDVLKERHSVKMHVFGWDFREVSSIISSLESSVAVSSSGLVTAYKLRVAGESIKESRQRATALSYLLQVAGSVSGAFEADEQLRQRSLTALDTLRQVESQLRYQITDSLTTLDELETYFELGEALHLITSEQRARLVGAIRELRRNEAPAMAEASFGKVGVTYTVSFSGDGLVETLKHDFTGQVVRWWDESGPSRAEPAETHRQALQAMYVERLIGGSVLGRRWPYQSYAVAALYRAGIQGRLEKDPVAGGSEWISAEIPVPRSNGEVVRVPIYRQAWQWARRHYFVGLEFSGLLDRMRQSLAASGSRLALADLERFLNRLVAELMEIGEGPQQSLPFMLLDEMVRRANPGDPNARKAVLEVVLFDRTGKEKQYIPIAG